jgi:hypothetical protein
VAFVLKHSCSFLAYCCDTWWQWSPVAWKPFPADRYLLPYLQQLGAEFAVSHVSDEMNTQRREWVQALAADHRLLPLCRRLRRLLAVDQLEFQTPSAAIRASSSAI